MGERQTPQIGGRLGVGELSSYGPLFSPYYPKYNVVSPTTLEGHENGSAYSTQRCCGAAEQSWNVG